MSDLNMAEVWDDTRDWLDQYKAQPGDRATHCWVDEETTGLNRDLPGSRLLEIGMIATDKDGYVVEGGDISFVISLDPDREFENDFVVQMHTASHLIDEAEGTDVTLAEAETALISWYKKHFGETKVPMSGSSVQFDRAWMEKFMPRLAALFHYRNIDISTLKELAGIHNPELLTRLEKHYVQQMKAHRALPDLVDTIMEYRFYINEFLWTSENAEAVSA